MAFHPGKRSPEVWRRKVRDSKWTGGNHEIRRISEYNGLVFFLVCQMASRKTPNFTGSDTIYCELTYSIAYQPGRKQGCFTRYHLHLLRKTPLVCPAYLTLTYRPLAHRSYLQLSDTPFQDVLLKGEPVMRADNR